MRQRQEVVNVVLAQLLERRGLVAAPEQVHHRPSREIMLPDVIVDFHGLRLAIEAEFNIRSGNPERKAFRKAKERVDRGLAHIGVAVVYPGSLQTASFDSLPTSLASASLRFAIITEVSAPETQLNLFDVQGFSPRMVTGTVDDLVDMIHRSYSDLAREDTVSKAVQTIEQSIVSLVTATDAQPAVAERIAAIIGLHATPDARSSSKPRRPTLPQRNAIAKIAALMIENALIFQEVLSRHDSRVHNLERLRGSPDLLSQLCDHWNYILEDINYYAIFHIAKEVLVSFSADQNVSTAINELLKSALKIVSCRAALKHDLAGRIYHRLLEESKYLGAYYTAIPSATLLLKVALRPDQFAVTWESIESLQSFHVSDLACGTGTLLMASADVIEDNYVRACVQAGTAPDSTSLQRSLVANTLYGYDVLSSAIHLTASTLALRVPEAPINITHLYRMPLGGPSHSLGTLDFLDRTAPVATLFGVPEQVSGRGVQQQVAASIPNLDLCVMNPPFTRSVGGNLLFGNFPQQDRRRMQKRLRRAVKAGAYAASITAGLGSVFVALGDRHLKRSGSLALVLPRSLLSGVAWGKTRRLIEKSYHIDTIIVSHEPGHWNFSENTSLSEVMLVARKRPGKESRRAKTTCINLWKQPKSQVEALSLASHMLNSNPASLEEHSSVTDLHVAGMKMGEALQCEAARIVGTLWSFPCSFAQTELNRTLNDLRSGRLVFPGRPDHVALPLTILKSLGSLGFDRRDIHDGFELSQSVTSYPAVWGQDCATHNTMSVPPNAWLRPLRAAKAGRHLRNAGTLWSAAGQVLLAERARLNTMCLLSAWAQQPVLTNVWWVFKFRDTSDSISKSKALLMWLNSTLGLLMIVGHRSETEGAFVDFKKPVLEGMPVLDVEALPNRVVRVLAESFDGVAGRSLHPFPQLEGDPVRIAVDIALGRAIGLPDLHAFRSMLAREPILAGSLRPLLPDSE